MQHVNSHLPSYHSRSSIFQWDPCKDIFRKSVHTQLLHVNIHAQYVCLHTPEKQSSLSYFDVCESVARTNSNTCMYTGV